MTILATFPQLRLDGITAATYAHGLETISGLDVLAGRRSLNIPYADHPGEAEHWDDQPTGKVRTFELWALPNDADGNVTHTNGPLAHLRENIDSLQAVLAKRGTYIAVELDVPTPTGIETRTGRAKILRAVEVKGTRVRTWKADLYFPFPYWNVEPQVVVGPFTGAQNITPGGGARVHDIVITTVNGTVTNTTTGRTLTVAGAAGTVVINTRTLTVTDGGLPAPNVMVPSHGDWMWMDPGLNSFTASATPAATTIAYYAARE